jgi:sec-independent protein translocase protein TatC
MLTIGEYYSTVLKLLVLFGLAFEMPVLICLLGMLGVVDAEMLRRSRKTAVIVITVVSGVVAPPDIISMLLLMMPLIVLYELSIYGVVFFQKRRKLNESSSEV